MGPYDTAAHCGSTIFCHRRNAARRHSSSHEGSSFFAEMKRTVSSVRPGGADSETMSLSQPCS